MIMIALMYRQKRKKMKKKRKMVRLTLQQTNTQKKHPQINEIFFSPKGMEKQLQSNLQSSPFPLGYDLVSDKGITTVITSQFDNLDYKEKRGKNDLFVNPFQMI